MSSNHGSQALLGYHLIVFNMEQHVEYLQELFKDTDHVCFPSYGILSYMKHNMSRLGDICVTIIKADTGDSEYPIMYKILFRIDNKYCIKMTDYGELFDYVNDLFEKHRKGEWPYREIYDSSLYEFRYGGWTELDV